MPDSPPRLARRVHVRVVVCALAVATFAATPGRAESARPSAARPAQPNIVFVLTDDLDVGYPGGTWIDRLPRLKALLQDEGTTFANHFVSVPLCCPSRATILRGQYAHNTGVLSNDPPDGGFQKFHDAGLEAETIAVWLQRAGYRTGFFGKYLNGYGAPVSEEEADAADGTTRPPPAPAADTTDAAYRPPGWTEWFATFGVTLYFQYNYAVNENGAIVTHGAEPADYLQDVIAAKALDFVKRQTADPDRPPFFVWLATVSPHVPAVVAPRHLDAFPDLAMPKGPSYDQPSLRGYPTWLRHAPRIAPDRDARNVDLYRRRARSMLAVEDAVVALVDALRDGGALDDTYIVLSSDNGLHFGQHRLDPGKSSEFEEDLRVPLLVRGPNVPAGRTVRQLTVNTDFAPTFAELAGVAVPPFVDGRSLVPLLRGRRHRPAGWRKGFFVTNGSMEPARAFRGVHTRRYAYFEYPALHERELYDLARDPYELKNVARTAPPDLVARLSRWTRRLARCGGAACRRAENAAGGVP